MLTLSAMGEFPDPKPMGTPPITHIENGIKRFLYIHYSLPLNFVENFFSFEGARPEKDLKI